jgi:hypothetical protein
VVGLVLLMMWRSGNTIETQKYIEEDAERILWGYLAAFIINGKITVLIYINLYKC